MSANIQSDWDNREFIQNVQYNLMAVVAFLNEFDRATRIRLAKLNEKLMIIERQVEYIEGSIGLSNNNNNTATSPTSPGY